MVIDRSNAAPQRALEARRFTLELRPVDDAQPERSAPVSVVRVQRRRKSICSRRPRLGRPTTVG